MIESRRGVQRLARLGAERRNAITRAEIDRMMAAYTQMHAEIFGDFKDSLPKRYPAPTWRQRLLGLRHSLHNWADS